MGIVELVFQDKNKEGVRAFSMDCGIYMAEIAGWTVRSAQCGCAQFAMRNYHFDMSGLTVAHEVVFGRSFESSRSHMLNIVKNG